MRTTLTLDDDVAAAIEHRCRELKHTLREEVNDLIRVGLAHVDEGRAATPPVRVKPLKIGKPLVDNFDDVSALASRAPIG